MYHLVIDFSGSDDQDQIVRRGISTGAGSTTAIRKPRYYKNCPRKGRHVVKIDLPGVIEKLWNGHCSCSSGPVPLHSFWQLSQRDREREGGREGGAVEIRLLEGMMSGHGFHPIFNARPGIGMGSAIYICRRGSDVSQIHSTMDSSLSCSNRLLLHRNSPLYCHFLSFCTLPVSFLLVISRLLFSFLPSIISRFFHVSYY
jgi:hypothetical protein